MCQASRFTPGRPPPGPRLPRPVPRTLHLYMRCSRTHAPSQTQRHPVYIRLSNEFAALFVHEAVMKWVPDPSEARPAAANILYNHVR